VSNAVNLEQAAYGHDIGGDGVTIAHAVRLRHQVDVIERELA